MAEDGQMLSDAEWQQALDTCLEDASLRHLYENAPEGARKVIELSFCSTVFPDRVDGDAFLGSLRALESELSVDDLRYLIRFEDDPALKAYFKDLLSSKTNAAASTSEAPRRSLHVIRNHNTPVAAASSDVDLNAAAIKRRMQEEASERAQEAAKAAAALRKAKMDALKRNLVIGSVVGVILVGGGVGFLKWSAARKARQAEARVAQAQKLEADKAAYEAQRRQAAADAEKFRLEREEKARKSAEESRLRREAEAKLQKEKRAEEDRKLAEERQRREAERAAKARYYEFCDAFSGMKLLPWSSLAKDRRPGAADKTFRCVIPNDEREFDYLVVTSTNGSISAVQLLRSGETKPWDEKQVGEAMSQRGSLVLTDDTVYFLPAKANLEGFPFDDDGIQPAQKLMGDALYGFVSRYSLKTQGLRFAVYVNGPGVKADDGPVEELEIDRWMKTRQLRKTIEEQIASRIKRKAPKLKRRHAVYYDGEKLECRMEITRVPRNPRVYDEKYRKWAAEADREEEAEREANRQADEDHQKAIEKAIEKFFSAATLRVRMIQP